VGIDRKLLDLANKKEAGRACGGEEKIEKQHKKGKYTARERIASIPFTFTLMESIIKKIRRAINGRYKPISNA
jgi:hypothetical protein